TVDVSVTGTEFDVQLGPEQVRVSVAEGSVDVTHTDLASTNQYQTTKSLVAGNRYSINPSEGTTQFALIHVDKIGAWRTHRLIYSDQTIETIVADLDRYYDGTIFIADKRAKEMMISANFDARNVEDVLSSLTELLPLELTKSQGGLMIIESVAPSNR
ncbi:MAG: FecR domain-containing protein, partial [Pseudomonadota bacterium]